MQSCRRRPAHACSRYPETQGMPFGDGRAAVGKSRDHMKSRPRCNTPSHPNGVCHAPSTLLAQADGAPHASPHQSDSRGRGGTASAGPRGRGRGILNGVMAGGRGGSPSGRGPPRQFGTFSGASGPADAFHGGRGGGPRQPRQQARPLQQSTPDPAVLDTALFPALGGGMRPGTSASSGASVSTGRGRCHTLSLASTSCARFT